MYEIVQFQTVSGKNVFQSMLPRVQTLYKRKN